VKTALAVLLLVLLIELGAGTASLLEQEKALPNPEPLDTLFTLIPPQPAEVAEDELSSQTAPPSYSPEEILLTVEGDMILAHINKTFALPSWYVPPNLINLTAELKTVGPEWLRAAVIPDLKALFADAEAACDCKLAVLSAYRSYQTQALVYTYWVNKVGRRAADRGSARPGHSEHQLGTTVDLTSSTVGYRLTRDFGNTCEGIWLERNAYRYGFVLSYPKGKEAVVGYAWEPWHFRWIGRGAAAETNQMGITLEEYLFR